MKEKIKERKLTPDELQKHHQDAMDMLENDRKRVKFVNFKMTLSTEAMEEIEAMQKRLGTDDPADVFRRAMPLLKRVLDEMAKGRVLVFRDRSGERRDEYVEFEKADEEEK